MMCATKRHTEKNLHLLVRCVHATERSIIFTIIKLTIYVKDFLQQMIVVEVTCSFYVVRSSDVPMEDQEA